MKLANVATLLDQTMRKTGASLYSITIGATNETKQKRSNRDSSFLGASLSFSGATAASNCRIWIINEVRVKKKPPLNTLTEEELEIRLNKIILSGLGKAWMYWPPRAEVKRRCAVPGKSGWFKCEDKECNRETEKIEIDHIIPIVQPEIGRINWEVYIRARFVKADKLQGLCHESHQKKTKKENAIRREMKRCASAAMKKEKGLQK